MALEMNVKHTAKKAEEFKTEVDMHMVDIPRDLRFHFRDTIEEREYKKRQQIYYHSYENYGYLGDALAKDGLMDQAELDADRAFIHKRVRSRHILTDELLAPKVDLDQIKKVQEEYNVPSELKILDSDSADVVKQKVRDQVQHYIKVSQEALSKQVTSHKEAREKIFEAEKEYRATEDVELFLMENEDKLAQDFEWDETKIKEFADRTRKLAVDAFTKVNVENLTKSAPLRKLGIISGSALDKIEGELKLCQSIAQKRSAEFELRYGQLPEFEDDPYMLEMEDQMEFLKVQQTERFNVKQLEAAQSAQLGEGEEGAAAAEDKVEEDDPEKERYAEELFTDDDAPSAIEARGYDDFKAYNMQRTPRTWLSTEQQDGDQWPLTVDGIELAKYDHLRDVDYASFEDPPDDFETRLMDAFAAQREKRQAKKEDVTLIPRVPVPAHPDDEGTIAKTLLLYRMQAIRYHIIRLKENQVKEYERAYRDIGALNLQIPYDKGNPWKQDMFEEVQLVLKNQGSWTTGQKEKFLQHLHSALTSDMFSQKNVDSVKF